MRGVSTQFVLASNAARRNEPEKPALRHARRAGHGNRRALRHPCAWSGRRRPIPAAKESTAGDRPQAPIGARIKRDSGRGGCEEEAEVLQRASEAKRVQEGRQRPTACLLRQRERTEHRTPASQRPYPRRAHTDWRYRFPTPAWRSHSRDRQHSRDPPIAMLRQRVPPPWRARVRRTPSRTGTTAPRTRTASRAAEQECLLLAIPDGALFSSPS